jgi:Pyruvate/2-oxoacid:ferredoxin oxidoreductase delta subunit
MDTNHAGEVLAYLMEDERHRVGIFLHPCEMRSLRIITEDTGIDLSNHFLMSADCLAVYEQDDFVDRSAGQERSVMTQETLRFARLGGILPSRYRLGCQLCERPFAEELDLYFQLFGLQTSEHIGVSLRTRTSISAIEARFSVEDVPDEVMIRRREVLGQLASWRSRSIEETEEKLDVEISTVDALSTHLAHCRPCNARLLAHCPSSPYAQPRSDVPDSKDIIAWLSTCGGCGMCEYECPDGYPLFRVIITLRKKLKLAQA